MLIGSGSSHNKPEVKYINSDTITPELKKYITTSHKENTTWDTLFFVHEACEDDEDCYCSTEEGKEETKIKQEFLDNSITKKEGKELDINIVRVFTFMA